MTTRPKMKRSGPGPASWGGAAREPEPETAEEKAKRLFAQEAARKQAKARDALYFKQQLVLANLPESALVDLYNECVTILAAVKPPVEPK